MHIKAKLLRLEQHRHIQLLGLMYERSKNPANLRTFVRNTRGTARDTFHVERYRNNKHKNSPYYVENELWKNLLLDIVQSLTVQQF